MRCTRSERDYFPDNCVALDALFRSQIYVAGTCDTLSTRRSEGS